MTPAELGRFVREEVPRIREDHLVGHYRSLDIHDLLSALDCAMDLLREAEKILTYFEEDRKLYSGDEKHLATLRLVLGEGGEGETNA